MRALITGINGFVGKYLAEKLISEGYQVWGTSRSCSHATNFDVGKKNIIKTELNNSEDIYKLLEEVKPDYIFHLAGQSNVKKSWEDKEGTFFANVNKTIFLLDAIVKYRKVNPDIRVLTVGSAEEYGKVDKGDASITEQTKLNPLSPYGASKATISLLASQYFKAYDLQIIHVRPFNHIGSGQGLGFVLPDFANQIAEIEKGFKTPLLRVGNLETIRDFTDVRDIVEAYKLLIEQGKPGEIYNVSSGVGRKISDLLQYLLSLSKIEIEVETDVTRLRPSEVPIFVGNNSKIKSELNWEPKYSIESSIENILQFYRK